MPLQVRLDDRIPLILGHVEEHSLTEDAGDGYYSVDPPPSLHSGPDDLLAALEAGDTLGDGNSFATGCLNFSDQSLGHLAGGVLTGQRHADIGHYDPGPLGRGSQGYGVPDPTTCTGNSHDFSL